MELYAPMSHYKYAYAVGERYILSVPHVLEGCTLPRGTLLKVEDHDEPTGYVRFAIQHKLRFLELLPTDDELATAISSLPKCCHVCDMFTGVDQAEL